MVHFAALIASEIAESHDTEKYRCAPQKSWYEKEFVLNQKLFYFEVRSSTCKSPDRHIRDVFTSLALISKVFYEHGRGLMPHVANVAVEEAYMKYRDHYNSP